MAKSFFDFFPPPKFLDMPAPGLSITESGIRLIEFAKKDGDYFIKNFGNVDFTEGTIIQGEIKKADEIVKALSEMRDKYNLSFIRSTLPEEKSYIFSSTIKVLPEQDLNASVESIIEENVPVQLSDSLYDFFVADEKSEEGGEKVDEVCVSVVPQDIVNFNLEMIKSAGLQPLHFEVESQAIAKAIIPKEEKMPSIILSIDKNRAGIYIVNRGAVSFSSTITFPTTSLTESIIAEIEKVIGYWRTKSEKQSLQNEIGKIRICADNNEVSALTDEVKKKFFMTIENVDVWRNIFSLRDYIPEITLEESYKFAAAVGLALPKIKK